MFSRLYELRQSGDYDDMFDATEEEVMPYFIQIEKFINEMEALITFK
ncbi:putative toxin-antitoxin system, antitoxin component [Prevotella sp. ICM33]|nr:putative toxin-antitoxin system, antitoxin component [Prevotella sp. ICM33]